MRKSLFCALIASLLLSACAKNGETVSSGGLTAMSLASVCIDDGTRAVLSGTAFSVESADSLGLFLTASDGGCYDGRTSGYGNVLYVSAVGESTWTASSPIVLSSSAGILYGYYPYASSVSDIKSVPVKSSLNGTDYMYAGCLTDVSSSNESVSLTLHHALALVSVRICRDAAYTGEDCILSGISISGAGVAGSGTLNATDGSITAVPAEVSFSIAPTSFASDTLRADLLIVPVVVSDGRQEVSLKCIIGGVVHGISLKGDNGVIVKSGVNSYICLTMSEDGGRLSVTGTGVENWNCSDGSTSGASIVSDGMITVEKEDCQNGGEIVL